jgi:NCAIR mutase (PurE)-related protein
LGRALKRRFPKGRHFAAARIFYLGKIPPGTGSITVLSAGTADIPVAEEASVTAEIMGSRVRRIYDVGVAGIHRLLAHMDKVSSSRVLVVAAGMDGVLASVVGGLFSKPIIAVPTSVGYGLNLSGLAPLLTMLNSCAPGIAVVNIDNGFGAGYLASIINRM